MADDKRAEIYVELARLKSESFYDRRKYDWMITVGFWAVLIGIIYYDQKIGWWWLVIAVLVYALIWLLPVFIANENDKDLSDHFMFAAEGVLRNDAFIPDSHPKKVGIREAIRRLRKKPSPIFQLVATVLLALLAYLHTHGGQVGSLTSHPYHLPDAARAPMNSSHQPATRPQLPSATIGITSAQSRSEI